MKKIFLALLYFLFITTQLLAQKGQASLSVGPLLSFPVAQYSNVSKVGYGAELNGQYGISAKGDLAVRATVLHYTDDYAYDPLKLLNLQGGYRYQFGASGFYLNGLAGTELDLSNGFATIVITVGGGKRFTFNNGRQLDVGVDYLAGDIWVNALNLKAAILLFKKQRVQE